MIDLRTLGESTIKVSETVVRPDSQVLFALSLYLVAHRGQPVARSELVALLWPDCNERSGRHRLRQAIYQLRRLGARMTVTSAQIELAESSVIVDYEQPVRRRELVETLAGRSPIRFLPHYSPNFSVPFECWVDAQREYVQGLVRQDLRAALISRSASGETASVIGLAKSYLELDPLDREATFALAEAHATRGEGAEAVALLEHYRNEILTADSESARATAALQRRILRADRASPVRGPHRADLVGREDIVRLLERWVATNSPTETVFALWGEAGIGKTRLLFEATRLAMLRGVRAIAYRPGVDGEDRPLAGIFEILPRLLELPGAVGCSPESFARLRNLARGIGEIRTVPEDTPDSTFRYATLRRAIFDLVEAISAEGDVMLAVDDVHWLDSPSLTILLDAARDERNKLRVLLAFRSGNTSLVLGNQPHQVVMRVPKLDVDAARAIVTRDLDPRLIAQRSRLIDWAIDLADGNPFFLIELSTHCRGPDPSQSLPASLQIAIQRKLDALSETARLVVQACAFLGHCSTLDRVDAMLGLPPHALASGLAELEALALIDNRDTRLACKHDLVADEVTRGAGSVLATYLHGRCATVLENEMQSSPSPTLVWECARHWEAAGHADRAFQQTIRIADQLLALGLPKAAVDLCTRAERYSRTPDQHAQRLVRLRHGRKLLCDWDGVIDTVAQEARLLGTDAKHPPYSDEEIALFEARWYRDFDGQILSAALNRVRDGKAPALHRLQMGVIALVVADNYQQRTTADRIVAHLQSIIPTSPAEDIELTKLRLVYHSTFGDLDLALAAASRLVDSLRVAGVSANLLRALRWASSPLKYANKPNEASDVLTESYEHARRLDLQSEMFHDAEAMVDLYLDYEDVERALQWAKVCTELAWETRNPGTLMLANASYLQSRVALARGDIQEAARLSAESRCHPVPRRHLHARQSILALDVLVRLRANERPVPRQYVARLRRLHLRLRASGSRDFETGALLLALVDVGEVADARRLYSEYLAMRRCRLPAHSVLREAAAVLGESEHAHGQDSRLARTHI